MNASKSDFVLGSLNSLDNVNGTQLVESESILDIIIDTFKFNLYVQQIKPKLDTKKIIFSTDKNLFVSSKLANKFKEKSIEYKSYTIKKRS